MAENIKVICCECKKILKEGPDNNVSHGYCEACSIKMLWHSGFGETELTEFINERNQREIAIES